VDELVLLCDFTLHAGNCHDLTAARLSLEAFRGIHVVGDKGFDSQPFREELAQHGATGSTIPRKGYQTLKEQPKPFNRRIYAKRHLIENLFQRMKAHKRLALRAEKTSASLAGFITFAALLDRSARA
jgi:transposase